MFSSTSKLFGRVREKHKDPTCVVFSGAFFSFLFFFFFSFFFCEVLHRGDLGAALRGALRGERLALGLGPFGADRGQGGHGLRRGEARQGAWGGGWWVGGSVGGWVGGWGRVVVFGWLFGSIQGWGLARCADF